MRWVRKRSPLIQRFWMPGGIQSFGIGVTAYGVLSRGLLSGSKPAARGDFRAWLPRFSGDNLAQNQRLIDALKKIGRAHV